MGIEYTVGSGHHAKSYLFREGEFFGQSPLTWYEEPDALRMSPGFESGSMPSFHRKIGSECVFCHVGSIDRLDHNPYKFEIVETTIGCERCHGPGELHAKRYRENPNWSGEDLTIVNPDSLPRELSEAVCQQCHLQGVSWCMTTGHDVWDFRPGQRVTDVRVDYQFALGGGGGMRIVGHVEQMHASECYKQTETMTCVTCHDPHNPVPKEERIDFFRSVCLDCHEDEACGKPHGERMQLADNNCYQCHMPRADTNVTHAAFHHHQIAVHTDAPEPALKPKLELIPVLDVSYLPEREQIRCVNVAKVLQLRGDPNNPDYDHFGHEATESLIRLKGSGRSTRLPTPNSRCWRWRIRSGTLLKAWPIRRWRKKIDRRSRGSRRPDCSRNLPSKTGKRNVPLSSIENWPSIIAIREIPTCWGCVKATSATSKRRSSPWRKRFSSIRCRPDPAPRWKRSTTRAINLRKRVSRRYSTPNRGVHATP